MITIKFEIYPDNEGKIRFRLVSRNGEVIATGEGYETVAMCKKGIKSVQKCASAKVVEVDE